MAKEKRTAADVAAGIEAQELEAADQPLREQTKAAPVAEQKAPAAEKEPEKLYTADEVAEIAKQAAAEAVAKAMAEVKPQVVQVMADTEKVTLRWCAPVADDNLAVFGPNGMYGTVTGKNGTVMVPKSEWSRFYDETARRLIDRRWLVVLSGMTDAERAVYHCAYRKGEVLDETAFRCAVTHSCLHDSFGVILNVLIVLFWHSEHGERGYVVAHILASHQAFIKLLLFLALYGNRV